MTHSLMSINSRVRHGTLSCMHMRADTLCTDGPVLYLVAGRRVDDPDQLIGATEAGRILGLTRGSVWRIPGDSLPFVLTPGGGKRQQRRYRRGDVERYRGQVAPLRPSIEERVADLEEWRRRHEAEHQA